MNEEKKVIVKTKPQNIVIENREKLSVSGVLDVESFNEEMVIADTDKGLLFIHGEELRINKLSIDNSELNIEGKIISCEYSDKQGARTKGRSFLSRLFK